MSNYKILDPVIAICALLTYDSCILKDLKNKETNCVKNRKKIRGGATSLQELMKHSLINMHAKNHGDQCISCSDTVAFVSYFSLFLEGTSEPHSSKDMGNRDLISGFHRDFLWTYLNVK